MRMSQPVSSASRKPSPSPGAERRAWSPPLARFDTSRSGQGLDSRGSDHPLPVTARPREPRFPTGLGRTCGVALRRPSHVDRPPAHCRLVWSVAVAQLAEAAGGEGAELSARVLVATWREAGPAGCARKLRAAVSVGLPVLIGGGRSARSVGAYVDLITDEGRLF